MRFFYIKAAGNDANTGLSDAQAWQTVSKVNAQTMLPGDVYQFNGGDTFTGTTLTPSASGSAAGGDIIFQSYGTGRATINIATTTADGFNCTDLSYIKINNINFTGPGSGAANAHRGIFFNYSAAGPTYKITVRNVNVTGFGADGIAVLPTGGTTSVTNGVIIDQCVVNNCTWGDDDETAGIHVGWGNTRQVYQLQGVTVSRCVVHDCPGLVGASTSDSGNGIFLRTINGARVTQSVAYNNCLNGPGAVGMWCYDCNGVTFEYNECYNTKGTSGSTDGGGFDIDGFCNNCTIQYCYSHGNWGDGILIFNDDSHPGHSGGGNTNNIIRFNVCEGDGQNSARAHEGIGVFAGSTYPLTGVLVYGNTVYYSATVGGSTCFTASSGSSSFTGDVCNNIFYGTGSGVFCTGGDNNSVTYAGNDYYAPNNAGNFIHNNGVNYGSLAAFQASGQEKISGNPVGFQGNPTLTNAGSGGTLNVGSYVTPAMFKAWTPYTLAHGTAVFGIGVDISANFSITPPTFDLFMQPLKSSALSIGANSPKNAP